MSSSADYFKRNADGDEYAGDHLLIEFWGAQDLTDVEWIQHALERAAEAANATVMHSSFHTFGDNKGVSGVTLLAESHLSIHTWPERCYAAIDVFMCGACDPKLTLACLEEAFKPARVDTRLLQRGIADKP